MRILHTADVHLRENDPQTTEALDRIVDEAEGLDVDVLTIGGDLFHSPADAEALRPRLRSRFNGGTFDTLILPGNHDADVYQQNLDFGREVDVLRQKPLADRHYDDAIIVGIPYTEELTETVFEALTRKEDRQNTRILLLHCTLDVGFGAGTVGDEDATEYFPVTRSTLGSLEFDYVLAGHIHVASRHIPLSDGGVFVYPGSPVSHSKRETGPRHATLVDTDEDSVRSIPLETHYVDRVTVTVRPGAEERVLERIEEWIDERASDMADLSVHVDGFTEWAESDFGRSLETVAGEATIRNETRGAMEVLDHPLYRQFQEEIATHDVDHPEAVRTRVLEVISRLLAKREIRP